MLYEHCVCCNKPIRAGHPFVTCNKCNCIYHKKCKTKENITTFRDKTYRSTCTDNHDIVRYNPFYQSPHFSSNESLDDEPIEYIESINTASNILENCQTLSTIKFNNLMTQFSQTSEGTTLSTYFRNIDGNSSNFDNLALELASINHKFSIIGLAETNTDPCNSQLYQL